MAIRSDVRSPDMSLFSLKFQRASALKGRHCLLISVVRSRAHSHAAGIRTQPARAAKIRKKAIDGRTCPPYMAVHRRGRVSAQPRLRLSQPLAGFPDILGREMRGSLTLSV